ncbi:MAG: HAMP domain-containing histidine kinase [Bacteroidetes bacterium]|nr:HAMP domain-containing histidine kinase [Bacteroidota bacterium]MBS1980094.1 HAMP domain-containing histidine kinase [Bacteroidota bacterium]
MANNRLDRILLREKIFASKYTYKRAILRGQLSIVGACVGIVYTIFDLSNQLYVNLSFYFLLVTLCIVVFFLNRTGKYNQANLIFLSVLIFILYGFADNDESRTGVSVYFIIYALIALTLCGREQLRLGLLFSFLAFAGFFLAYFVDLPHLIQAAKYADQYITFSFVINFVVTFLVSVLLIFFSLDINYQTEQELSLNNQLLLKTNRELDRFVYSASHDLRAPLSSLLGLIELTQRSTDPEELKYCLKLMRIRVKDLDAFINEIIDYSRNTRQELRPENFNLLELVKEATDGLKFGLGMEDIFIKYEITPDLIIHTDRSRLKVILNNLIGNALKYSKHNEKEQVVKVIAKKENQKLTITIEDNGIGIEEIHLPKIFDMFYRASEKSHGSGLGLYIVKETLERLSGKISVSSIPNQGSVFNVEIPVH